MAKEFFKAYLVSKEILEQRGRADDLNMKCLSVFEKYLFSYKWCRNETERQIFLNAIKGIAPNKMVIQTEKKGVIETLKPESIRSASSRLSRRFYQYFGNDFNEVLICDVSLPENRKKLNSLIAKCISINDQFIFQNHYSSVFQNMIETVNNKCEKVEVPDTLEFSEEMLNVLTFFKIYDNSTILSQLKGLDKKSISLIYKILTTPEYYLQRAEVLEYLDGCKISDMRGVKINVFRKRLEDLTLEIKAKDMELSDLRIRNDGQDSKELLLENKKLRGQINDLKTELQKLSSKHTALESEYQRLKTVAMDDHNKSRKEIEDLKQQVQGLLNL